MINKKTRVDQYLWAIRIFKTRSLASKALAEGKVKLNGENVKASHAVVVGELYNIKTPDKRMTIQVSAIISKRVQFSEAILNYFDISTDEDKAFAANKQSSSFYTGKRLSNTGKPTKKQNRDLSEFLFTDTNNDI
jgi:ribosome-associated heat shock protein Hsp15